MPDHRVSFHDLYHSAISYTQTLEKASIQPGEVAILILEHGKDLVSAFWGAILGGVIPSIMPFLTEKLSPEKYRSSLSSLLEITKPASIITYPSFKEEVELASKGTSVRSILDSSIVSHIADQQDQSTNQINIKDLKGLDRSPEEIVLLQHSSGTTGLQKGVALSNQAIFNQLESYSKSIKLRPEDVVTSWLPLYHDMGLIAGFILPITQRIPLVLMSPFDWVRAPYRLMQAITRYQGTLCWLPNFAYNFCAQKIRESDLENIDLSSLRAVTNCSEPMYWSSHQMFIERFQSYGLRPEALATSYAMAENVFAVTQGGIGNPVNVDVIDQHLFQSQRVARPTQNNPSRKDIQKSQTESKELRMLSAGQPIDGTKIRIVSPEGKELPERHLGEIVIQSDCMLTGYYRRPGLSKKALQKGWFHTGDLGYIADDELYVSGRIKDLIIVGGKKHIPTRPGIPRSGGSRRSPWSSCCFWYH
jgi:fatty-acyl-CoA synthase